MRLFTNGAFQDVKWMKWMQYIQTPLTLLLWKGQWWTNKLFIYKLKCSFPVLPFTLYFDTIINLDEIKSIPSLSSIVFEDNKLSKMHDFLPLKLYGIHLLSTLEYSYMFDLCSYFYHLPYLFKISRIQI